MPHDTLPSLRTIGRRRRSAARAAQRGAATLVVVMVLFFIVALVAAYTSRNLIFEQRTSANQYRATQAFEAAEAGLEWALAMLNGGRIDAACRPHTDPDAADAAADDSFRQRYLDIVEIAPDTGRIKPRLRADDQPRQAACVFDGTDWQCSCPTDDTAPVLTAPTGAGPFPAFVVRFFENDPPYPALSGPYPPGVVRIQSTGCTRLEAGTICAQAAASGDGRATVTSLASLKSALGTPPAAAVTVRGNLTRDAGATTNWDVVNADLASGGITVHAGGNISPDGLTAHSQPGTPGEQTFFPGDTPMFNLTPDHMFTSVFGIGRDTYHMQPATVWLNCAEDDCSAATVRDLVRLNPGRVLWINGDFNIDIADPIGTVDLPALLVVTGNISVSIDGAALNGVLYVTGESWTHGGTLALRGAVVGESNLELSGSGTATLEYDPAVLDQLHRMHGSFVRVPGSWRDF